MAQALEYAKRNGDRYLSELKELLSIPTISTLTEHKADVERAAQWLSHQLTSIGLRNVEVIPTRGHPVVYGDWVADPTRTTVLIYGHYDVQPVDPLDEWLSLPFEPTVRGENIFARGSSDMKGNDVAILKALEAWLKNDGLPVNVKVIFEGEEEIGSPNLEPFIESHRAKLKCDLVLNADAMISKPDLPSLAYGLRGLLYLEVWVYGPEKDLHSGEFGGSVHNPAQVLCELVAGMHDADGRVTLPGFYDQVRTLSDEERAEFARTPHSDEEWRKIAGAKELYGEKGFSTAERLGARPTLEVNGILSGFTGEGVKTVLPANAMAKISMRLVPNQDPKLVEQQFKEYMRLHAPPTVRWEMKRLAAGYPVLVNRDTYGMRAATTALELTFGVKPVFRLEGGTVPMVNMVMTKLGVDVVMMGFSMPEDNFHAPNEKYHLPNYYRGIEAYIRFFGLLSRTK